MTIVLYTTDTILKTVKESVSTLTLNFHQVFIYIMKNKFFHCNQIKSKSLPDATSISLATPQNHIQTSEELQQPTCAFFVKTAESILDDILGVCARQFLSKHGEKHGEVDSSRSLIDHGLQVLVIHILTCQRTE